MQPNALREVEEVVRVVAAFYALQPREVSTVVGVLPVVESGIDVVDVGGARDSGRERGAGLLDPHTCGCGVTGGEVLDGGEFASMHERGRRRADALELAAVGIEQ